MPDASTLGCLNAIPWECSFIQHSQHERNSRSPERDVPSGSSTVTTVAGSVVQLSRTRDSGVVDVEFANLCRTVLIRRRGVLRRALL